MSIKPRRNDPCPCGSGKKYKRCCIGRPVGPAVDLIEEEGKPWTIVLRNFKDFDDALGRDALTGFCRCFVHTDRLVSLTSGIHACEQLRGRDSVAFSRDLQSFVFFTIGTLRELALAIRATRAALAKRDLLDADGAAWTKLRDLEKRWNDDPVFRDMRNKVAFHVDADVVAKGLEKLVQERDVSLCGGEGRKSVDSRLALGVEALYQGLDMDLEAFGTFARMVGEDHGISETIQQAFVAAAEAAGIPFGPS